MFNELDKIVNSVPLDQQALATWVLKMHRHMKLLWAQLELIQTGLTPTLTPDNERLSNWALDFYDKMSGDL